MHHFPLHIKTGLAGVGNVQMFVSKGVGSCEALESALIAFPGTIIAVSHDRYFINKVATRIIELDPTSDKGMRDYELESYDDAFSEYMRMRQIIKERNTASTVVQKSSDSKADYEERKRENAKRRGEERKIKQAQEKIPKLEARLIELEEELFGDAASNYVRAAEIEEEKTKIEEELLELYELVM